LRHSDNNSYVKTVLSVWGVGKLIINLEIILIFVGVIFLLLGKLSFVSKLSGDIYKPLPATG
jgi:hypothetical protein